MEQVRKWEMSLGTVTLRRARGTPYFVSKCGLHYLNIARPHIVISIGRAKLKGSCYLSCGDNFHMHVMVARAWVYNPCPSKFKWVDHINGDRQDNHAKNLRWVSPALNGLNKKRDEYAKKETRKYKSGRIGVYYRGKFTETQSVTDGNKQRCAEECKRLINDTWMAKYRENVAEGEKPRRPSYATYWQDYYTTPVMRPGLLDTPVQRAPEVRAPQFVV